MLNERKNQLQFIVGNSVPRESNYPVFLLQPDNWDDYGYQTRFNLFFYPTTEYWSRINIGTVKILSKKLETDEVSEETRTKVFMPSTFSSLDQNEFCSLGQTSNYYDNLGKLAKYGTGTISPHEVVTALCDICFRQDANLWWETMQAYTSSLLRFPAANIVRNDAKELIQGNTPDAHNSMIFNLSSLFFVEPRGYDLHFDGNLIFPGRINVLIGQNGVGKTKIIKDFAENLASFDGQQKGEGYTPEFSKILYISTNIFDFDFHFLGRFSRSDTLEFIGPSAELYNERIRYALEKLEKETLPRNSKLCNTLEENLKFVISIPEWKPFISGVFKGQDELIDLILHAPNEAIEYLSAGQKSLLTVYAGLFRHADKQCLIFIDEPENYLHPSLLTKFIREFNILLSNRKAFSILATHSPIVVQETARRFVTIVEREGDDTFLRRPPFETFGESLENICEYLFETDFSSSHWKKVISEFVRLGMSEDEVLQQLRSDELPLLTKTYLIHEQMKQDGAN